MNPRARRYQQDRRRYLLETAAVHRQRARFYREYAGTAVRYGYPGKPDVYHDFIVLYWRKANHAAAEAAWFTNLAHTPPASLPLYAQGAH